MSKQKRRTYLNRTANILLAGVLGYSLLAGCGNATSTMTNNTQTAGEQQELMENAQEIQIVDPKTDEIYKTITEKAEIDAFLDQLDVDNWMPAFSVSAEDYAPAMLQFLFRQQKTGNPLQKNSGDAEPELYTTCTLTAYPDCPYLFFQVAGFTVPLQISESAQSYLTELAAEWQES